jgi:hypothetical protein
MAMGAVANAKHIAAITCLMILSLRCEPGPDATRQPARADH